jgi:hypothetical protein
MELEGLDVVKYLSGHDTVRDGALVSMSVRDLNAKPVVELVFEKPHNGDTRIVKLELHEIQDFSYDYAFENPPGPIEFFKCVMTEDGEFYLSLDPYDERDAFISDRDNEFFRSKRVKLIATIKR